MNNNGGTPDISQMLASVMSNPQFAEMVKTIKEGSAGANTASSDAVHNNATEETGAEETTVPEAEAEASPPKTSTGGLSLSPDMLAKLPQMISALSAVMPEGARDGGSVGALAKTSNEAVRRRQLFTSLKPFLSNERSTALDTIIKLTEMTGVIESFKGFGSGGSGV